MRGRAFSGFFACRNLHSHAREGNKSSRSSNGAVEPWSAVTVTDLEKTPVLHAGTGAEKWTLAFSIYI